MYFYYYVLGIILLPAIILSIYAQFKVQSTYNKYKQVQSQKNFTGKQVAEMILSSAGISNVQITEINGTLTDYYDSKNKVLALSKPNYNSSSIASLGVTAHECGHALQDASGYFPLKLRHIIIKTYNFSSKLLLPLLLIGFLFDFLLFIPGIADVFLIIGSVVFGLSLVLSLITLPVEFNASKRALQILEQSTILSEEETKMAKKVLNSAALTYVAEFIYSLLNFLRFVLIFARRRD